LYEKAKAGIIENYTGISSPFEAPLNPDVVIDTRQMQIEDAVTKVLDSLRERAFLSLPSK
jgi:adenylylsulfate kinase